jgi:hypothetical protein
MLRIEGAVTTLLGDVNGDGIADFGVSIAGTGVSMSGWLL